MKRRSLSPVALSILVLSCSMQASGAYAAGTRNDQVYTAVEANRTEALDLLEQIVNIDSGSGDVDGGTKIEAVLATRLKALGADVSTRASEVPGLPDAMVAVLHGIGRGKILIIAHIDTVFAHGAVAARPFRIEEDRARGPGVGDEKAGVVNAVIALKILHDIGFKNYGTITLLLDNSEERGSPGVARLIQTLAREHDVEFNMEPGDPPDALTVWRKGGAGVHIQVKGRAAHAGMAPQSGRNAAIELVHQWSVLEGVYPRSGDGVTVNLTVLRAGDRINIIPDYAEGILDVRFRRPEDLDAVVSRAQLDAAKTVVPDTVVTVVRDQAFPPLVENPATDALADRAKLIYSEIGKALQLGGNGGASESALAMAAGTAALDGLGFVGGDFHTDHEWIDLKSVAPRMYLFTRLLMDTGARPPQRSQTH